MNIAKAVSIASGFENNELLPDNFRCRPHVSLICHGIWSALAPEYCNRRRRWHQLAQ
jgi:hypothetical protein